MRALASIVVFASGGAAAKPGRCPASVEGIGAAPARFVPRGGGGELKDVAADPAGCAIAAWMPGAVVVSWDGGQRFVRYELRADDWIDRLVPTGDRVMLLRNSDTVGVVRPGDAQITWHELEKLWREDEQGTPQLVAAGNWTAMYESGHDLYGVSTDDGATWTYPTGPQDPRLTVGPNATLVVRLDGPDAPDVNAAMMRERYVYDPASRRLIKRAASQVKDLPAWFYRVDPELPCCDRPIAVVARGGGAAIKLVDHLSDKLHAVEVVSERRASYAIYNGRLYELRGKRALELDAARFDHLDGMDGYGALIGHTASEIWRWSARDGWRGLWDTGAPRS